ncbi:MAG: DUF3566 domain-containing protein [bacterium]|nr:DUF3566 domain-containing protein [bacterium]
MSTTDEQRAPAPPPPPRSGGSSPVGSGPQRVSTGAYGSRGTSSSSDRPRLVERPPEPVAPAPVRLAGPRRVRLSVARIAPWSVMKLGFLLAVAFGIMSVVATAIVWQVLDSMAVFDRINTLLLEIGNQQLLGLMEFAKFDRVMSMSTIVSVANVVLLTALATLGAFLYNIVAALVGGIHLTLTDD